jgi:guanosine-3',5'-bis(diphosphate) 3'-pyrophosphohydrolase
VRAPRQGDVRLVAGYVLAIISLCVIAPGEPLVATLFAGVLVNLLAAELDRSGGSYARWLVGQAARLLPNGERERWTEEWLDHVHTAGEHGMRPLLAAWTIALLAAPRMAWETRRRAPSATAEFERGLLDDLFAVVEEHRRQVAGPSERSLIARAFTFAVEFHADQRRPSGEDFIVHPVCVAKICAGMRLDTATLCAALLHETANDSAASAARLRHSFGDEIASLVEEIHALTCRRAGHYAELLGAARDMRATMVLLADRLHDMRTACARPKDEQRDLSRETLDVFAPLADRLGIHAMTWEIEDLAFEALDPRGFKEIKGLVNRRREERERYVTRAGTHLALELDSAGIDASASGRAKHFYSIHSKMAKTGCGFEDIEDLTALRILVDTSDECYRAVGVIHALWQPCPGRFRDYVATPKENLYQGLHTTVVGPEDQKLRIQIRTRAMHEIAEYGIAVPEALAKIGPAS